MHKRVYEEFKAIIQSRLPGDFRGSVLEIGATPNDSSLLLLPMFTTAETRVGINLQVPRQHPRFELIEGNANEMRMFGAEQFDVVLSNATLEHDKFFWRTIDEIRRILSPGGLAVVGVPGFRSSERATRLRRPLKRLRALSDRLSWVADATLTYRVHNYPGDYYRFSSQAVRETFLRGMDDVEIRSVLTPPRLIGSGLKPTHRRA